MKWRRLSEVSDSQGCSAVGFPSFTLNFFHMELFYDAPSVITASTMKPELSVRMIDSKTSFVSSSSLAAPLIRKHAKF